MLKIDATQNNAILSNGKSLRVLRYDADYLRKYSDTMLLYNWTRERVLNELRSDLAIEIEWAFKNESESDIEKVLDAIMPYAAANIHDPRERRA